MENSKPRLTIRQKLVALPTVAAGGLVLAGSASAQTLTDSATAAFGEAETGVGAVAATMLGVVSAGIAVKWILGFLIS
jgi:hypothetical protein